MSGKANVLYLGSPYWCQYLAGLFNDCQFLHAYTWKNAYRWIISRNKSVCLVGLGAPDTYKRFLYHGMVFLLEEVGIIRKRVIYWIGSDVTRLTGNSRFVAGCLNVAGSSWLANEVCELGYDCQEKLFPVKLPENDEFSFPKTRRLQVLCYIPEAHHELHGSSEIRILAEHFADVDFTVVGGAGRWWPNSPENIRFLGWVDDLADFLAGAHVVLRRTSHDSLSAFVREALVAGRHVIFTYDTPGAIYVKRGDIESLLARMGDLSARLAQRRLAQNDLDPEVRFCLTDTESQLRSLSEVYD